jgi:hypothetical protein
MGTMAIFEVFAASTASETAHTSCDLATTPPKAARQVPRSFKVTRDVGRV